MLFGVDLPISEVFVHKVHAHKILPVLLVVSTLHFLNHYSILFEVVSIQIVGTAWISATHLLYSGLCFEEREVHILVAVDYQSVVMRYGEALFVDQRIADPYFAVKTYSICEYGNAAVVEVFLFVSLRCLRLSLLYLLAYSFYLQM